MLALITGLGVVMRKMRKRKKIAVEAVGALEAGRPKEDTSSPAGAQRTVEARMAEQQALHAKQEAEALMSLKFPAVATKKTDVLVKHIASEAKKDPEAMAHVVRSWLSGEDRH